jgi:predicted nucleic acid-binding protein
MMIKNRKIFLDTSVLFAAVLSPTGGSRKLFLLGEAGVIILIVGPTVLRECEEVIQRKVPASLPTMAFLLEVGKVDISNKSSEFHFEDANAVVSHKPDAYILAEAMSADPDWFVTHDKAHFIKPKIDFNLTFRIGTPGDFLQEFEDEFTQS